MLRIITGTAGSGKTYYARSLAASLADEGKRPVLIVPEQYSFETERAMLEMLGAAKAARTDVFSFTRLCEYVSRAAGKRMTPALDRCGRAAAMSAAIKAVSQTRELVFYAPGKRKNDIVRHMLNAVLELKQCGISPDEARAAAAAASGTLSQKLSELAAIYEMYDTVTGRKDPFDELEQLRARLGDCGLFEGRTVIFDSFKGFTGQELAVVSTLMQRCGDCVVCLYADKSEPYGLFEPVAHTAERLISEAKRNGVKVASPERLTETHRFKNEALAHLERSVFRTDGESFDGDASCVTVYSASGRGDELEYCARECRRLVREEGFRYRDIAVIARNDELYSDMALDAFSAQGLPLFFDRRAGIENSGLIQLVGSAVTVAACGRNTDDMLRMAKSGLISGISREDAYETENYCILWGIRGGRWKEAFDQHPEGLYSTLDEKSEKKLALVNRVRERIEKLTDDLRTKLSGADGRSAAKAVYDFIKASGAEKNLDAKSDDGQVWDALMDMLDRTADVLGDIELSPQDFSSLFELMCSLADIGHIPQGQDEIIFSSPERFRPCEPKAVFIIGAADGEFPAVPSDSGVFTDEERKTLIRMGLSVSLPFEERIKDEKLLAYKSLTCASEKVYITYPTRSEIADDSITGTPSEIIDEVKKCLSHVVFAGGRAVPRAQDIEAGEAAFELFARATASRSEEAQTLAAALREELSQREEFSGKIRALDEMRENLPAAISAETSKKIYGERLSISPTQAENFFRCRFKHFCQYGLRIAKREVVREAANVYGTLTHYILEHYLSEKPAGDVLENVRAYIERFIKEEIGGAEGKSARFIGRLRDVAPACARVVSDVLAELECSDFVPDSFELKLRGDELEAIVLSDGSSVSISGTVDRVDIYESGGRKYLRVIDYKTKEKPFKLGNVLDGVDMQMLMYLAALTGSGRYKGCIPAGVFYRQAALSDKTSGSPDKKRNFGMVADLYGEDDIISAMEHDGAGKYIPVSFKNGKPNPQAAGYLLNADEYMTVHDYVIFALENMVLKVKNGNISASPDDSACEYCDYAAICRYDGEKIDHLTGYKKEEVLTIMNELMNEKEGDTNG